MKTATINLVLVFILSGWLLACQSNTEKSNDESGDTLQQTEQLAQQTQEQEDPKEEENTDEVKIQILDSFCKALDPEDTGCSCNFRQSESDYQSNIFNTNLERKACMNLGDGHIYLTGGRTDKRFDLQEKSYAPKWIVLNENGQHTLFGKPLDMGSRYEDHRQELIDVLLVMDEIPNEIPIESIGTVGMGFRGAVRDMCGEAIDMAKTARAKGDTGTPMQMVFKNDDYVVSILANIVGKNDSGGDRYKGNLNLTKKDGTLIERKQIWGTCGC